MSTIKWYDKKAMVILFLVVFFPVGLYGLWKGKSFGKVGKVTFTAIIFLLFVISLSGQKGDSQGTTSTTTAAKSDGCLIEAKSVSKSKFSQGRAYINSAGQIALAPKYSSFGFFEGLARTRFPVLKNENILRNDWGFIDASGKVVIGPLQVRDIGDFHDGLAMVFHDASSKNGVRSFIDKSGKEVIPPQAYEKVWDFHEGLAAVRKDSLFGFMDKTANIVIPHKFHYVHSFHEGYATVKQSKKYGFIDKSGNYIIKPQYDLASDFSEGLVWVANGKMDLASPPDQVGFITPTGDFAIPMTNKYLDITNFSEGLCAVKFKANGKWGYINKAGNIVIQPTYDTVYQFSEGLAGAYLNGKYGFIDTAGNVAIQPQFDEIQMFYAKEYVTGFQCGIAKVTIGDKTVFIDKKGNSLYENIK